MSRAAEWYEAYTTNGSPGLLRIAFLFMDGSVSSYPYSALSYCWYEPTDDRDGGAITMLSGERPGGDEIVITGRHLGELHAALGERRIAWVRELPPGGVVAAAGTPVVYSIAVREHPTGRHSAPRA